MSWQLARRSIAVACFLAMLATAPMAVANIPEAAPSPDLGLRVKSLPGDTVPGPSRKQGTYTARVLIDTQVRRQPGKSGVVWRARTRTDWSSSPQWV
ncbi:MAG: hypothetical protein WBW62_02370, partial [Solirubrobacterales bacterium]